MNQPTEQVGLPPLDPLQRYTIAETQRYLRTSHQSLYDLITEGTLKTIQEGRRRYVPGTEIARLSSLPS